MRTKLNYVFITPAKARVIVLAIFLVQDLFPCATTPNIDQSSQLLQTCDYVGLLVHKMFVGVRFMCVCECNSNTML